MSPTHPAVLTDSAGVARRWGILHRFVVGHDGDRYLDRLTLLTTPWFSIKLHRIFRPDRQRELHDHPWSFVSIPILGSYEELFLPSHMLRWIVTNGTHPTCAFRQPVTLRFWNRKRAEDAHTIVSVSRSPVWTLVLTGPRRRVWGFYTEKGWVPFAEYERLNDA